MASAFPLAIFLQADKNEVKGSPKIIVCRGEDLASGIKMGYADQLSENPTYICQHLFSWLIHASWLSGFPLVEELDFIGPESGAPNIATTRDSVHPETSKAHWPTQSELSRSPCPGIRAHADNWQTDKME